MSRECTSLLKLVQAVIFEHAAKWCEKDFAFSPQLILARPTETQPFIAIAGHLQKSEKSNLGTSFFNVYHAVFNIVFLSFCTFKRAKITKMTPWLGTLSWTATIHLQSLFYVVVQSIPQAGQQKQQSSQRDKQQPAWLSLASRNPRIGSTWQETWFSMQRSMNTQWATTCILKCVLWLPCIHDCLACHF